MAIRVTGKDTYVLNENYTCSHIYTLFNSTYIVMSSCKISTDQRLHSQVQEIDQQAVDNKRRYCNILARLISYLLLILGVQFDPITFIKTLDYRKAIKISNAKISNKLINFILQEVKTNDFLKRILIIRSATLLINFLINLIYSAMKFDIKQEPLGYFIVCEVFSIIGSIVVSCKLVKSIYEYYKNVHRRAQVAPQNAPQIASHVAPQGDILIETMNIEDIENDTQNQSLENIEDAQNQSLERRSSDKKMLNEALKMKPFKDLALELVVQVFIYPTIICSLHSLINEKSWQFDNTAVAALNFIVFLYSLCIDALETKLNCIYLVQKVIVSLFCNDTDNWKVTLKKCWLPSLLVTPQIALVALMHWLILAIIGVRIYADNFSRREAIYTGNFSTELDQGDRSDMGDYEVASYTGYMIFCGFYLPVASIIVYIVLNRIRLSDDEKSKLGKMLFFLTDPIAYIVVPFLMVPFIPFCVGTFLSDYDSSEFGVDPNAQSAATILGGLFIAVFLLCNIQATLIFVIIVIVIGIIVIIICLACLCGESDSSIATYHHSVQKSNVDQSRLIQKGDTDQSRSTLNITDCSNN